MGLRDRFTDALGGALNTGVSLLTEGMEKANAKRSDEPARRATDGTTAMTMGASRATLPQEPPEGDPKALLYDPFALIDQLGFRDRPTSLTYNTLREMSRRVPTFTAILQTRLAQVSAFGQRQRDQFDPGFGIILRDDKASPTRQDNKRMRIIEDFILQTGFEYHPGRDNFRTFLRKVVRDSLELDQVCFEIQRNRKGLPAAFYALDGGTFRMADVPPGADSKFDPEQVKYVQVYDEIIISEFAAHELCFGIRNPRTDIRVNGYGFSELEMLINVITATLWAFDYNKRQFSQGSLVNGLLNFKGTVPDKMMNSFRRQWRMMVSGVSAAHRVPAVNFDDVQWIDFGRTNRDMEYSAWFDWLFKVTCAVCLFDPAEAGFNYGNSGQTSQMFQAPVESKLVNSKDKGLRPLLKDIAEWINVNLIWPLDPYFEFAFLGMSSKTADQAIDQGQKRGKYLMTVDELRAEEDLDPLPDGLGDIILDPTFLQNKQAVEAQQQQDAMGDMGDEGEPEDLGDVTGVDQGEQQPDQGNYDFDSLFPEKSMKRTTEEPLRKSAKVKVYEIDL